MITEIGDMRVSMDQPRSPTQAGKAPMQYLSPTWGLPSSSLSSSFIVVDLLVSWFVYLFVCLPVYLLSWLRKKYITDFHEMR